MGSTLAADFYVAQNTAGNGSGTNAANALSLAWLNMAANWNGAGKVSAGDTVHFVGTLTNTLMVYGSGTPGSPIRFHFESGAKFSAPTLANNANWINLDGQSWVTLDGGVNGLIELTDNGTPSASGGTHAFNNAVTGIYGAGAGIKHVVFENLSIRNLYQRQTNTDGGSCGAFYIIGSDVTYSNLTLGEVYGGITQSYTPTVTSNLTVVNCTFTNYNHGIEIGCGASLNPQLRNLTISHNTFQAGDMFETYDGGELGLHRNPIFLFNESACGGFNGGVSSGCISNIEISYNFIRHGCHPLSHTAGTAAMFFDLYRNDSANHVRVFNNISTLTYPLSWSGGGGFISAVGTDVLLANNTAVAWQTNGGVGGGEISARGTNVLVCNNILVSSAGMWYGTSVNVTGLVNNNTTLSILYSNFVSDYNIFNLTGNNSFVPVVFVENTSSVWSEPLFSSLTELHFYRPSSDGFNFDNHSLTNLVAMNASYQPLTNDVVAIGHGTNLTAFAIADNLPGLTNDYAGNPRPATGNWTIGAYQVGGTSVGGGTLTLAVASTNLNYGVTQVGSSTNLTFAVQNTGLSTIIVTNSVAAPFSIVSAPSFSLTAGQIQMVTVAYNPIAVGTNTGTLRFNGSASPVVVVSGITTSLGTMAQTSLAPPTTLRVGLGSNGTRLATVGVVPGFGGVLGAMQVLDSVASYTLIATNSAPSGSTIVLIAESSPSQGYPSVSTADGTGWRQVYAYTNGDYYAYFLATNASMTIGSKVTITWAKPSYQYHQAYACYITNCSICDVGGYASVPYYNGLNVVNNCSAVGVGVGVFSIEAGQALGGCSFNYVQFPIFGGPSRYLCWSNTSIGSDVLSITTPNYQAINACWVGIK